jgi:hypothetical protein
VVIALRMRPSKFIGMEKNDVLFRSDAISRSVCK